MLPSTPTGTALPGVFVAGADAAMTLQMAQMAQTPDHQEGRIPCSGVWMAQYLNGQIMEVLVNEDDGKVMASRLPGDTRCERGIS